MGKSLKVSDKYRKNKLSIQPGGVTVVIEYYDGRIFEYDKIKNPTAYMNKMDLTEIKDAWIKSTNEKINLKRN